jgi:hypothetical protein
MDPGIQNMIDYFNWLLQPFVDYGHWLAGPFFDQVTTYLLK